MYRNFWKSTVSVENRRLFSRFLTFDGTFLYKMALKIVEIALKMVENHEYYTGNFDRRRSTVDFCLSTDCQKCTKIFDFCLLTFPVYFPKITWITITIRQIPSNVENFENNRRFSTDTVDFRKFRYIFPKFYTGKVGINFGRFSTVKTIRLSTFAK